VSGTLALADLTRMQVAEAAPEAVLVLAFGAVEQHGPHLPFGTDFAVVDAVARRAVERAAAEAAVVLAPTLPYGLSDHHLDVGGALSLSASSFQACAGDLLAAAAASGFRRAFLVNGHGGNEALLRVAAQAAAPLRVAGGSYWELARPALERILPHPARIPGHAGRFETSLALALGAHVANAPARDDWQDAEAAAWWHEDRARWARIDGYTDSPAEGSPDEGEALVDAVVASVARCIVDFAHAS
jgi:creatinine amidohydrolase